MKLHTLALLTAVVLVFGAVSFSADARNGVVGSYYVSNADTSTIDSLPGEKLTHVIYAFLALCGDNTGASKDTLKAFEKACKDKEDHEAVVINEQQTRKELAAFAKLKKRFPHLVLLPSFGGWTLSKPFHGMAKSDEARQRFVQSAMAILREYPEFDGIDIDWEYPGGGGAAQGELEGADKEREKRAFRLMMKEFRTELNALSLDTKRYYQLTAAVSGSKLRTDAINWRDTAPHMDYVFVMTYDFAVGDGQAGHHTNLLPTNESQLSGAQMIDNLIDAGVPANKLVFGVAFYGRGWVNAGWHNGKFDLSGGATSTGAYVYKSLVKNPPKGYQPGYDEKAEAAFLFNPTNNGFISYDSTRSVSAKVKYAKEKGLAGVFSWQILQDDGSLLDAMHTFSKTKHQ